MTDLNTLVPQNSPLYLHLLWPSAINNRVRSLASALPKKAKCTRTWRNPILATAAKF